MPVQSLPQKPRSARGTVLRVVGGKSLHFRLRSSGSPALTPHRQGWPQVKVGGQARAVGEGRLRAGELTVGSGPPAQQLKALRRASPSFLSAALPARAGSNRQAEFGLRWGWRRLTPPALARLGRQACDRLSPCELPSGVPTVAAA